MDQGMIPADFGALRDAAIRLADPAAAERLADLYAVLGLYGPCHQASSDILRRAPRDQEAAYRRSWCSMMSVAGSADASRLPKSIRELSLNGRRGVRARLPLFGVG